MTEVTLRQGAGSALRHLGPIGAVVLTLPTTTSAYAAAVTEGAALGAYAFRAHKSPKSADSAPVTTTLVLAVADPADAAVKAAVKRAEILSSATTYARDLVNAPPNVLYPETFVEAVRDQVKATKAKVSVVVHDEQDLATMGCGGILGVVNRQLGIGTYSPRLDARGHSVRGIRAFCDLSDDLGLHAFNFMNSGSTFLKHLV